MWVTLLVGNLTPLYYRKNALLQAVSPNNVSPIDPLHGDVTFVYVHILLYWWLLHVFWRSEMYCRD